MFVSVDSRAHLQEARRPSPVHTLGELAQLVGGRIVRGEPGTPISRVMPTGAATEGSITFVTKPKYLPELAKTRAAAVMLSEEMYARPDTVIAPEVAVVLVEQAYVAYARTAQAFAARTPAPVGVHALSVIDPTATLGKGVAIGPFVVIGPHAKIGDGAVLYPGVHVEEEASVGEGSVLFDHVVIRHRCHVGARNILHPGVVIGSDGFGFAQHAEGGQVTHVKIPQVGDVRLEDDVEIGSNSCVDRAALGTTRIGAGTKIDNLVQVGHNVEIGPGCLLVAQSGVAGSTRLGANVIIAAQAGVSGHLQIGDGAVVLGQSGVADDVPAGQRVFGSPAVPQGEHVRALARIRKLDSLFSRVKKLEKLLGRTSDE